MRDNESANTARTVWPPPPSEEDLFDMLDAVEISKRDREDELFDVDGTGDSKDAEVFFFKFYNQRKIHKTFIKM